MDATRFALGTVLVVMLAPVALGQSLLWTDDDGVGVDLTLVSVHAGTAGVTWEERLLPPAQDAPPSPPPMWTPSDHAHEEHAGHEEPAPQEEPAPAPEEEKAPLVGAVPRTLVPLPIVGSGPVPRLDLTQLDRAVGDLVPLLPRAAPAYGPAPAPKASSETPSGPIAVATESVGTEAAIVLGMAAVAAAAPPASLWRLRRLGWFALLYSRIAKERLLDHGSRERLLDAVRASAGATITDLAQTTQLPRNTVTYHLRVMERERLVSSMRQGRHRLYFAPGSLERRQDAGLMVALRNDTARHIAAEIARTPGLDQKALCERTGISPSLAHWHARRLVEAGAVDCRREGRSVRYFPAGNDAPAA